MYNVALDPTPREREMTVAIEPAQAWALITPEGALLSSTVRISRAAAKGTLSADDRAWDVRKREGWRCVRVEIRAVSRSPGKAARERR